VPGTEELSRDELVGLVRAQAALLADQAARLQAQAAELDRLRAELDRLKRLVSRNSGNSSMPPSTDDLPGRRPPVREAKPTPGGRKRKRGKQPGSVGTNLAWAEDAQVVDHRPAGVCECGTDLAGAVDEGVERACQVTEIPLVTVKTTEHRMHRTRCACGRSHVASAAAGAGVANTRVYGPNLRTLVVYLLVFQHVPVHRCVQLVADLTGAAPSVGFVHGMLARCAAALAEVTRVIKALVTLAAVVHFDETALRVGTAGVKKYVWSASTNAYTLFALGRRTGKQFRSFAVGSGFRGVAVHDRYAVYDAAGSFPPDVRHQLCCSHLLRDLADAAESYPDAVWPTQCARVLRELIHATNIARDAGHHQVDPKQRERLIGEFRQGVLVGLKDIPRVGGPTDKQLPARCLLEDLRDRHDDVMRFCYDTTIPATNNQAERDLRPTKTQQKISGRLTSDDATEARLTIRGYVCTAVKHGVNAFHALKTAITGQPWLPPAAAALSHAGP
jgi:transposase